MTALRRIRSALGGTTVILTYHRIANEALDAQGICVPPARFEEHVSAFARRYECMTAGDLCRRMAEGRRLPRNGLVITLDDGYVDALTNAKPVLEAHGVPATVFVASGFVDEPREFWWDELERLVLTSPQLPAQLEVTASSAVFSAEVPASARVLFGDRETAVFDGWDVTQPAEHPRQRIYLDLSLLLEPLAARDREEVLTQLRQQIGAEPALRPDRRPLTAEELRSLSADGLVEVGAHTIGHVRLASLPLAEQREEIEASKQSLERVLGREVATFSYPHGTAGSFTDDTVRLVREAGFLGAVTTQLGTGLPWGSVSQGTNRFTLPRTATGNVPASDLVALIDKRLGA